MSDQYYNELFTKNKLWNTSKPNMDETLRWWAIDSFVKEIAKPDMSILDVGCGRGIFSNLISKYGNVIGIDPVESVIEYGRELYPSIGLMALDLDQYCSLYPEKKYDLVLCTEVLEHVIDKTTFMQKIKNLLSDNGHLILTTPREEVKEHWMSLFGDPSQPIEEWITTDDLIELIDSCGFKRVGYKTASWFDIYQVHLLSL